MRYLAPRRPDL